MAFAEVAVQTAVPYRQAFSYAVPAGMQVAPGSGVLVPFGAHTLAGVVLDVTDRPAFEGNTRDLLAAAGVLLSAEQIALAHWLSRRYLAPLYPCVALMLPPGFEKRLRVIVSASGAEPADDLDETALRVLARVIEDGEVETARLRRSFRGATEGALAALRSAGLIRERLIFAVPEFGAGLSCARPARFSIQPAR